MEIKKSLYKCKGFLFLVLSINLIQVANSQDFASANQTQSELVLTNIPLGVGTINQRLLRVGIVVGTGTAQSVTQLNFTLTGASQIAKLTVFNGFTGSIADPKFESVFGSVTNPGTTVSIDGSYSLTNPRTGTNDDARFVVLVDLKPDATIGATIDIVCDNMVVGGFTQSIITGSSMTSYATVSANLSGAKTIKATGGDYTTIRAAFTDINNKGVGTGGLELVLDDDATYIVGADDFNSSYYYTNLRALTMASNPLTIRRSNTGTNRPVINMTPAQYHSNPFLAFYGSDYVTIDGLSFVSTSTLASSGVTFSGIATDGCNNNVVKNCNFDLKTANTIRTSCVRMENNAIVDAGKNCFNKIFSNTFMNSDAGVSFNGNKSPTFYDENNEIYSNTITGNFGLEYGAISLNFCKDTKIYNNTIDGIGSSSNYASVKCIRSSNCIGFIDCYANTIKNITSSNTTNSASVHGIYLIAPTVRIYNNMISNLRAEPSITTNTGVSSGIMLSTSNAVIPHYYLWNNSVYMNQATPVNPTENVVNMAALYVGGNEKVNYTLNNNIFVNTSTGSNNRVLYAPYTDKSKLDAGSDNNLYYPEGTNFVYGYATLAEYKKEMASVSKEQNSVSALPSFVSISDLHITNTTAPVNNGGKAVATVTTDIDGDTRDVSSPDLGADEVVAVSSAVAGNWSNTAMWAAGTLPASGSEVVISRNSSVTIDQDVSVASLRISPGAKLTLRAGYTLTTPKLNINSDATGTGTYVDNGTTSVTISNVQQYLTTGRNWYISSPVNGATATTAALSTASSISYYNEPTATWLSPVSGSQLTKGKGYISVSTTSTSPVTFSGTLNTGVIEIPITRTSGVAKSGFNLVGNPYPSYLDWSLVDTTAVSSTVWYRTKTVPDVNLNTTYVFDTYNGAGNVGTSNGATTVTKLIPPMQAFWIRMKSGETAGTLTFTNDMRAHADNVANKFKAPSVRSGTRKILRLQVSNGTNNDETVLYFNPNASNGLDAYDSQKMTNSNAAIPEIYTVVGKDELVINGLNSVPATTEVPLGFRSGETNTFTIKSTETGSFDADTRIVLKDNLLNTEQDLTDGSAYHFSSDAVSTTDRFSVIFKTSSVSSGLPGNEDFDTLISVYRNGNNRITVHCTGAETCTGSVSVYNAVGQKLDVENFSGPTLVSSKEYKSGVYLVSVLVDGQITTRKVIID